MSLTSLEMLWILSTFQEAILLRIMARCRSNYLAKG